MDLEKAKATIKRFVDEFDSKIKGKGISSASRGFVVGVIGPYAPVRMPIVQWTKNDGTICEYLRLVKLEYRSFDEEDVTVEFEPSTGTWAASVQSVDQNERYLVMAFQSDANHPEKCRVRLHGDGQDECNVIIYYSFFPVSGNDWHEFPV